MWPRLLEIFLALAPMVLTGVRGQQVKTSRPVAAYTIMLSEVPPTRPPTRPTQSHAPTSSQAPTSSKLPATIPSIAPIYERSDAPSNSPTSVPTLECHDIQSYRSPLNEFRCEHHAGTDCFQWRFLGLSPAEVEELIDSCPISCEIECNSLINFEVVLSFAMLHVDNFLAPETTEIMQEVSTDYLTKYSRPLVPESRFTLYGVELRKQSMANGETEGDEPTANSGSRKRVLRTTQENLPALAVSVAFRGFALNLNETTVEDILREGIFSTGYSRMLRFTDDWSFRNVQIAELTDTLGEAEPTSQSNATRDESSLSGGAIFACIFAALVIISAGVGFFFLYHRNHHQKLENDVSFGKNEFGSELNSPCSSAKSPIREVVSFDNIIRLMSNGSRRSGSASPTDLEGESMDQKSRQSIDVESKNSAENSVNEEEEEEEEHPYANLIPPMIVYDNIDLDEEPDSPSEKKRFKNVVPSKKVSATKLFAESLRVDNGSTLDESTYVNVLGSIERDQPEPEHHLIDLNPSPVYVEDRKSPVPFSEDSCCTPQGFRKTLSDSHLDVSSQSSSPLRPLDVREEREPGSESSEANISSTAKHKFNHSATVDALETIAIDGEVPKGIMGKAIRGFSGSSPWKFPAGSRCNSPSQLASSISVDALETIGTDGETPKDKVGKATRGFGSSPWKLPSSRCNSPSHSPDRRSSFSRKSSRCSDSDHLTDQIDPDGSEGIQLVFQAPRKGKLGLVIQCLDSWGPIVTQVKDYSPLLGQVLRGDRIVDIDGMSTSGMSLRDVTGLMGGKVAQSRWAASVFRIVVRRQNEDLLKRLETNASTMGYLLSDSPMTIERHHSTVPPRSTSTPPRIRGSTPPPVLRGRGALTPPPTSIPLLGAIPSRHRRSSSLNRATDRARMKNTTPPPNGRRRSSSLTRSDRREDSESRRLPF